MDIADIKRKAEAAREFDVAVGAAKFTLRLPTQHEVEIEVSRARLFDGMDDPALLVKVRRALVERAIVRWQGVTCEDLAPGGGSDAADLVPGAAALLLDSDEARAKTLTEAFIEQRAARQQKQDAAAKN